MALVQERIHPRGLNLENQRKVVHLRDDKGLSWENIAKQVRNRQGLRPSWKKERKTVRMRMRICVRRCSVGESTAAWHNVRAHARSRMRAPR